MLFHAVGEVVGGVVEDAGVDEGEVKGVVEEYPGAVFEDEGLDALPAIGDFGGVAGGNGAFVEGIHFGINIVGTVGTGGLVFADEELHKGFDVGIVANPTHQVHLCLAFAYLVKEGLPGVDGDVHLDANLVEEGGNELHGLGGVLGGVANFHGKAKGGTGFGVNTAGVTSLGHELAGFFKVEGIGEGGLEGIGDVHGRNGIERLHASAIVLLPTHSIKGGVEGLAEFLVGAKDRVIHVETGVIDLEGRGGEEANPACGEVGGESHLGVNSDVHIVAVNLLEEVELTGEQHEPLGGGVLYNRIADRLKGNEIGVEVDTFPTKPLGVAVKDHFVTAPPRTEGVGSGTNGVLGEFALTVIGDGFGRDGCHVAHCAEPDKLIVGGVEFDAQGAVVKGLESFKRKVVIGGSFAGGGIGKVLNALDALDNPFAGAANFAVGKAFETVDEVLRFDLTAFALEAGIVGIVGFAQTEDVDFTVGANLGKCLGGSGNQLIRTRGVVVVKKRLKEKRHRRVHTCVRTMCRVEGIDGRVGATES